MTVITGINYILKYITIEKSYFNNISQYYSFYCIFDQVNAALLGLLSKITPNFQYIQICILFVNVINCYLQCFMEVSCNCGAFLVQFFSVSGCYNKKNLTNVVKEV